MDTTTMPRKRKRKQPPKKSPVAGYVGIAIFVLALVGVLATLAFKLQVFRLSGLR